jgi:alcohol dehydrogenase class IV
MLCALVTDLKVPPRHSEFGVKEQHIPALAGGIMKVTLLLANNLRELTVADAEDIYHRVL